MIRLPSWRRGASAGLALLAMASAAVAAAPAEIRFSVQDLARATTQNVSVRAVRHDGKAAVEVRPVARAGQADGDSYAALQGLEFADGEIEVDLAADAIPGSPETVRGFVGLGFRGSGDRYEAFYLRMRNGRSADQLQRNHSAQYISHPDHGWQRLRRETPGLYESYVDLEPRRWTHVRIVVCGRDAALFVDRATQPTLLVHDLKHGPDARGRILLWVGPGTAGQFAALRVRPNTACAKPPRG